MCPTPFLNAASYVKSGKCAPSEILSAVASLIIIPPKNPSLHFQGDFVIGGMTYWTLYNILRDPAHTFGGDVSFPHPSDFTDEELGIPPEDVSTDTV